MANLKDRALEERKRLDIHSGQRYLHFKGGEYEVVDIAILEATGELLVIYRALVDASIWARPVRDWTAQVEPRPGAFVPRFARIMAS